MRLPKRSFDTKSRNKSTRESMGDIGYYILVLGFISLTLSVACLSSSFDQRLFSTAIFSKKTQKERTTGLHWQIY